MHSLRIHRLLAILVAGSAALAAHAQQGDGTEVRIRTNVFKPAKVNATPDRIAALKVPKGFKVSVFASGLKNARVLVVGFT